MGCLYCGSEILPIRRLQDPDFCSPAHRRRYHDKLRSALSRLSEPEPQPSRMAAAIHRLEPVSQAPPPSMMSGFLRNMEPRPSRPAALAVRLAPMAGRSFVTSGQVHPRAASPQSCTRAVAGAIRKSPGTVRNLHLELPGICRNLALARPGIRGLAPASVHTPAAVAAEALPFPEARIATGNGLPAAQLTATALPEAVQPWPVPVTAAAGTPGFLRDSGGWTPYAAGPVNRPDLALACLADADVALAGAPESIAARVGTAGPVLLELRPYELPAQAAPAAPAPLAAAARTALPALSIAAALPALPAGGAVAMKPEPAAAAFDAPVAEPTAFPTPHMWFPGVGEAVAPQHLAARREFFRLRVEADQKSAHAVAAAEARPASKAAPPVMQSPALPHAASDCAPRAAGFLASGRRMVEAGPGIRVSEPAPRIAPQLALRQAALSPRSGEGYCSGFVSYRVPAAKAAAALVETAGPVPARKEPAALPGFPVEIRPAAVASPKAAASPGMAAFASRPPAIAEAPLPEPAADMTPLRHVPIVAAMPEEPVPTGRPYMVTAGKPARLTLFWRNAPAEFSRSATFLAVSLGFHLPAFKVAPVLEPLEVPAQPAADDRLRKGVLIAMPGRDSAQWRRRHAVAQKVMAMAASILAAVALWVNGGHVTVGRALTSGEWLRQAMARRASTEYRESFRAGMKEWTGGEGWNKSWTRDPEGFVRPGQFAVFKPSLAKPDYRMEMLAQVERRSLAMAVRARDAENYYAVKLNIDKPGPRPLVSLVRYPVVGGQRGKAITVPVRVTIPNDAPYRVALDVHGKNFAASIDGQPVDSWTDDILPSGGVALYSEAGERARLYWMRVVSNDDLLGRICGMLAGTDNSKEARLDYGPRRLPDGMAGRFTPLPAVAFLPGRDF